MKMNPSGKTMNTLIRTAHPLLSVTYIALGVLAATAGIWIFATFERAILQGLGFMLLAPAGMFMAIGLCRLWERGCQSQKLALPDIPVALRRPISPLKAIRFVIQTGRKINPEAN
jgi:hypothetical protein